MTDDVKRALDDIYRAPLREGAKETINRQLRSGISDQELAELAAELRRQDRLIVDEDSRELAEPSLVCSLSVQP